MLHMSQVTRIHAGKTPNRLHYIPEWAEHRGLRQADIVEVLGADKGTVSRWFSGQLPHQKWLEPLAMFLRTTPKGLFRHPDDDWLTEFFADRTDEERQRAISILQNAFPKRRA